MLSDLFAQDDSELYTADVSASGSLPAYRRMTKPPAERQQSLFVGLENQGATCYLNSLVQSLYMTPELRQGLFSVDPIELGVDLVHEAQLEDEENKKKGVVEVNEQSLSQLTEMGIPEHHARRALIATKNGSLDEVFGYIEAHDNDPEFNKPPEEDVKKNKKKKPRHIPLELQRLFTFLKLVNQEAVSTHELTTKGFQWQDMDGQVQHDAHELNRLLLDALEKSLKRTSGETLCRRLYEGMCVNQITCLTCRNTSERSEPYYDINLQIMDCPDVCASLRRHCAAEVLSGDSAYQCEVCRAKREALRCTVLRTLPQVLTFSCSRFRIDRSTNWNRVKVTARSEFPLVVDMRPYTEGSDSGVHEPVHTNAAVEEDLHTALRSHAGICWLSDVVQRAGKVAGELLEQFGPHASLADVDDEQYAAIAQHLQPYLYNSADAANNSLNGHRSGGGAVSTALLYELHAVIMHRGSAHSGHYFAYIRDNLTEGRWQYPKFDELHAALSDAKVFATPTADASESVGPAAKAKTPPVSPGSSTSKSSGSGGKVVATGGGGGTVTNTSSGVSKEKHASSKQYVLQEGGKKVVVDKTSALGLILQVMLNTAPVPRKPAAAHDAGKTIAAATARAPAVYVFKTDNIAAEVGRILKQSWAAVHKPKLGSLEQFMRAQTDVLSLTGKGEVTLLNSNVQFVATKDYQKLAQLQVKGDAQQTSTSPAGTVRDNTDNEQCRLDEELARSLQLEDDQVRHAQMRQDEAAAGAASNTHGQGTAGDDWETAGAGKRKAYFSELGWAKSKVSTTSDGRPTTTAPATAAEKAVAASLQLSAVEARRQLLTTDILSHFFGNYFEFNDSSVKPIELSHLAQAFQGTDSAYLLVYRQLESPKDMQQYLLTWRERLNGAKQNTHAIVPPPDHWVAQVTTHNAALAEQRAKYEQSFCNIAVAVHFPAQFRYESPLLHSTAVPLPAVKGETLTTEHVDDSSGQLRDYVVVEIDSRKKARDLKQQVLELYATNLTILGIPITAPASKLCISPLQSFGDAFYPLSACADTLQLSELTTTRPGAMPHVLLWDGSTMQDQAVLSGLQGFPKQVCVSLLSPAVATEHKRPASTSTAAQRLPDVAENKLFPNLYLPSSLSLLEFAHKLCELCQIDRLHACISVLCVTPGAQKGEQTYVYTPLYTEGVLSGKPITGTAPAGTATSNSSSVQEALQGMLMTSVSALGEFPELQYLLMEDTENRGLQGGSLAEALVARKNAEWSVTVELDFAPTVPTDAQAGAGAAASAEADHATTAQIDFPRYGTVAELKCASLRMLGLSLSEYADTVRLRMGSTRGEMVLTDESLDLVTAGLRKGCTVYLERGTRPATDSLLVTVALVTGNSLEAKYSPDQSGVRGQEVELTVGLNETVQEVRDRAGVLLLGYEAGWTQRCAALTAGTGVRDHLGNEVTVSVDSDAAEPPVAGGAVDAAAAADVVIEAANEPSSSGLQSKLAGLVEFGPDFHGRRLRKTSWLKEPTTLAEEVVEETIQPTKATAPPATGSAAKGKSVGGKGAPAEKVSQSSALDEAPAPGGIREKPVLVKDAGWKSGDTLLLEEGAYPVKGQITVQLFLWVPSVPPAILSALEAEGAREGVDVLQRTTERRRACLVSLGSVDAMERDPAEKVQKVAYQLMLAQIGYLLAAGAVLEGVEGHERLLLRDLRADLLPGRCGWTSEAAASADAAAPAMPPTAKGATARGAPAAAGAKAVQPKIATPSATTTVTTTKTAAAAPVLTFKKLGMRPERGIVVEILPDVQARVRPPPGTLRIWLQRLTNPGAPVGQATVEPFWPPVPAVVAGGLAPTLGHLKRSIAAVMPEIPSEHISVYKYQPQSFEWIGLIAAGVGLHARKKGGVGSKKSAESNITQAPYHLKEGDQLLVFDARLQKLSPGVAVDADGFIPIALPEDVQLRRLREEEKAARKAKQRTVFFDDSGVGGGMAADKAKMRRREVMLSLGSGFDFSDDEN